MPFADTETGTRAPTGLYCWNASLPAQARLRTPSGRAMSVPVRLAAIEADHAGLAVVELAPPKHHATLPPRARVRITGLTPPPLFSLVSAIATVGEVTDRDLVLVRIAPTGHGQRGRLRLELAAWLDREVFGLEPASGGRRPLWPRRRRWADESLQLYLRVDLVAVGNRRSRSHVRVMSLADRHQSVEPYGN